MLKKKNVYYGVRSIVLGEENKMFEQSCVFGLDSRPSFAKSVFMSDSTMIRLSGVRCGFENPNLNIKQNKKK